MYSGSEAFSRDFFKIHVGNLPQVTLHLYAAASLVQHARCEASIIQRGKSVLTDTHEGALIPFKHDTPHLRRKSVSAMGIVSSEHAHLWAMREAPATTLRAVKSLRIGEDLKLQQIFLYCESDLAARLVQTHLQQNGTGNKGRWALHTLPIAALIRKLAARGLRVAVQRPAYGDRDAEAARARVHYAASLFDPRGIRLQRQRERALNGHPSKSALKKAARQAARTTPVVGDGEADVYRQSTTCASYDAFIIKAE